MTRRLYRPTHGQTILLAHVLPMLLFVFLLGAINFIKRPHGPLWVTAPELWIYPLQTLLCAALLFFFRRYYEFHQLRQTWLVLVIGLAVFVLWIAPQQWFHFPPRDNGFNPEIFSSSPILYWLILLFRFFRLVVVVPVLEEIFWRAFLLRFLISEKFASVPFGTFGWLSFAVVTLAFAFSHARADWPAALAAGALYNLVAYRTRSLLSCVLTHALTNFALGLWIVANRQWGFW
jgi:CAAX prenyl protease-like protein